MKKLNIEVHPVADLFPMLPADELQDLANDIKTRGQLQPIVLDSEGRILDGRNRFAACQIAEVEPEFVTYEGDDPDGYAMTVNLARRHMSKGQKAIVIARSLLLNNSSQPAAATQYGVSQSYIAKAQVVLEHASDLESAVRLGIEPLNDAYVTASVNKQKSDDEQTAVDQLRKEHPDLADLVDDGEMKLAEAIVIRDERREDKKRAERIAPIDVLVAESGARTFTERVEAEEITWVEAEELATRWKKEFFEAVERNVRRINEVAGGGWQALARVFRDPHSAFNTEVVKQLSSTAVKFIEEIRTDITELAQAWEEGTK